jgi:hypothetical protein
MSESFAERLSRFTPDASGLDRDALLFAAGRASVRPGKRWMAIAGALAASQLLTLLFLWPRQPEAAPLGIPTPAIAVESESPLAPPDPSSWIALRERVLAAVGDLPSPAAEDSLMPAQPPLRPFAPLPATLLN